MGAAARGDVVRLLQREANVHAGVVIFRSMTATARASQVVTSCNKGARVYMRFTRCEWRKYKEALGLDGV